MLEAALLPLRAAAGIQYVYWCHIEEAVRWNIKVSKQTDLTLSTFLGSQGMKKGDLSKFIEEAVRNRTTDVIFVTLCVPRQTLLRSHSTSRCTSRR